MVVGDSGAPRDLHLFVEVSGHIGIKQGLALRGTQVDEGTGQRDVDSVVKERPDPFDIVGLVPTKVIRDVEYWLPLAAAC